mgnify:CR=1 FL=1
MKISAIIFCVKNKIPLDTRPTEKMLNIISPNTVEGQSNSDVTPIYTNPFDEFELVDDIQPTKRYCIIS